MKKVEFTKDEIIQIVIESRDLDVIECDGVKFVCFGRDNRGNLMFRKCFPFRLERLNFSDVGFDVTDSYVMDFCFSRCRNIMECFGEALKMFVTRV